MIDVVQIGLDSWTTFVVKLNWIVILASLLLVIVIRRGLKKIFIHNFVAVDEIILGIGSNTVKLKYSKKDQEIAYKLWVELSTRKIGLMFDKENDVIVEVYNSWYDFFKIARKYIEEIPASRIKDSEDLINLTEKVLNIGLRPHLTTWQAKYRKWYSYQLSLDENFEKTPQEIQRNYPDYEKLVDNLIETNTKMIEYKKLMRRIAFDDKG